MIEVGTLGDPVGAVDLVISTIPAQAQTPELVRSADPCPIVFEVVYDPWPTPLAAAAAAHGVRVASGLDLLLAQALSQFEQFTGVVPAPEVAMGEALRAAASLR